jgi:hypothetical protein
MSHNYHIDLASLSLKKFKNRLQTFEIIPSHKIILKKIDERFKEFEKQGIKNIEELFEKLRTKSRLNKFQKETKLPQEYLVKLRREIAFLIPKPKNLSVFSWADQSSIKKLEKIGIKDTKQLFEQAHSNPKLQKLINDSGVAELVKLSDLSRIFAVGPFYAKMFYESGFDSTKKIANTDPEKLYQKLIKLKEKDEYKRAIIRKWDIEFCVDYAKDLQ